MTLKRFSIWIASMFVLVVVALTILITVSFKNKQPIIDEAYFRRGVHYQTILDKEKKADRNGWHLAVERVKSQSGYEISVHLTGLGECKVPEVTLTIEKRASATQRKRWQLTEPVEKSGSLSYRVLQPLSYVGEWEISAVAESEECRKALQEFIVL